MTSRLVAMSALSVVLLVAGFAAMWVGVDAWLGAGQPTSVLGEDWEAYVAQRMWVEMLARAGGPVVGAGLIAGIGALAIVVLTRGERRA